MCTSLQYAHRCKRVGVCVCMHMEARGQLRGAFFSCPPFVFSCVCVCVRAYVCSACISVCACIGRLETKVGGLPPCSLPFALSQASRWTQSWLPLLVWSLCSTFWPLELWLDGRTHLAFAWVLGIWILCSKHSLHWPVLSTTMHFEAGSLTGLELTNSAKQISLYPDWSYKCVPQPQACICGAGDWAQVLMFYIPSYKHVPQHQACVCRSGDWTQVLMFAQQELLCLSSVVL